jgi:6-methylsalicylate decarboxylase
VEASLKEIDYALDVLDAEGIGLLTSYGDRYPGDPAFQPIFDELDRRKAIVFFHPTAAQCSQCLGQIPAATLEFPFDTTRAITSLLYGGTFARCRNISFIFSHAGGAVPFLAERIARLAVKPEFGRHVPDGVVPELQRLYYDTALSANRYAFRSLLELVPPAQVLFGSDYPFAPEATMTATVRELGNLGLRTEDRRAIERENALRLLPRMKSA